MGKAMVRQRFFSAVIVAIACLEAAVVNALPPSASALESQAQVEFAKVGTAVRERLDREAAGDLLGARVAAQDADAHRYRFLDIKRELSRLRSPSVASPSVEATGNPFLPDASSLAPSASSPIGGAPTTAGRQDAVIHAAFPAWDMYRSHESRDPVGRAGNMYSNGVAKPASGERVAAATDPPASASPREPFLVYRARLAGSDSRE